MSYEKYKGYSVTYSTYESYGLTMSHDDSETISNALVGTHPPNALRITVRFLDKNHLLWGYFARLYKNAQKK